MNCHTLSLEPQFNWNRTSHGTQMASLLALVLTNFIGFYAWLRAALFKVPSAWLCYEHGEGGGGDWNLSKERGSQGQRTISKHD
jgi:hypothetical protein